MSNLRAKSFSIAHATHDRWRDSLGVRDGLKDGDVTRKIGFLDTPERPQERPQGGSPSLAGVAMHLAVPIAVIVACPFTGAMTDGAVNRMHITIARPLIGVKDRPGGRYIHRHDGPARLLGGLVAYNIPYRARVTADDADDRRAVVRERAMAALLVGPPSRWVCRVGVAVTFFPAV